MPQWDSKTFEEKATNIARAFNAGRGDLHDLTVKMAKDQGLNEEQIRRLGRAVNVKAFEQKFASLKGQADRIVEFDPVDPETVIKDLGASSPAAEKRASAAYPELPDQMRSDRGWNPSYEKTASVDVQREILNSVPKDPPIESQINHWRKVAEDLRQKVAGAEMRWDAAMEELQAHSKRIYWDRDEFEKDAMALFGGDVGDEASAVVVLDELVDAAAVEGLERAIERGARYAEAGADILFIEAPRTRNERCDVGDGPIAEGAGHGFEGIGGALGGVPILRRHRDVDH